MSYLDQILPQDSKSAQILGMANERARASQASDRDNRIAEIDRRIAELNEQIANWDGEGAIARYRFVYENDPSGYMNRYQAIRGQEYAKEMADINHKHAMELQKESQKRTDTQQKMDAWKQSSIAMDEARYNVSYWQQKVKEAQDARDLAKYDEANIELTRANAAYKRAARDFEALHKQMSQHFGLDNGQEGSAPAVPKGAEGNDPTRAQIQAYQGLMKDINDIDLNFDNEPIDFENVRNPKAEQAQQQIDQARAMIENDVTDEKVKNDLSEALRKKQEELDKYKKPAKFGGPKRQMKPGDWKKAVDAKNPNGQPLTKAQLAKMGYKFLLKAKQEGATNPNLDGAIAIAK